MSDRYSILFHLPLNLHGSGSPVVISAGQLLKDTQTGNVLAQIKLKSISPKTIKAVKVKVSPLDTVNKPLGGDVYYDYLDLAAARDAEFGQKTAVPLPNPSTRAFNAEVTEVAFEDNSVWTSAGGQWQPLRVPEAISDDGELIKQYKLRYGEKAQYKPFAHGGVWSCACGAINAEEEDTCHACGNRLSELFSCDLTELAAERDKRLAEEQAAREAKAAADRAEKEAREAADKARREAARKKTKKILSVAVPIIVVCVAGALLTTKYFIPNSDYNKAKALLDAEQYDEAITAFEKLDGYKDSDNQKAEAINAKQYKHAEELLAAGEYAKALKAFAPISDYRDSSDKKEEIYNHAFAALNNNDYTDAYNAFSCLDGYKDSTEKAKEVYETVKLERMRAAKVGDSVLWGVFEQDNNLLNGEEEIEWLVLEKTDKSVLVISRYALDRQQYHNSYAAVTWEFCHLRKWLNNDFFNTAFDTSEQERILITDVNADEKKPTDVTNTENSYADSVFLLSITEAKKYFDSDDARKCQGTAYCYAQGVYEADNGNCWWWLRETDNFYSQNAGVTEFGKVNSKGRNVNDTHDAVRPAMWIDLGA